MPKNVQPNQVKASKATRRNQADLETIPEDAGIQGENLEMVFFRKTVKWGTTRADERWRLVAFGMWRAMRQQMEWDTQFLIAQHFASKWDTVALGQAIDRPSTPLNLDDASWDADADFYEFSD